MSSFASSLLAQSIDTSEPEDRRPSAISRMATVRKTSYLTDSDGRRRKSSLTKSAPTTPGGTKKHAHFDDGHLEERYSLQRRISAPSSFESSPKFLLPETWDIDEEINVQRYCPDDCSDGCSGHTISDGEAEAQDMLGVSPVVVDPSIASRDSPTLAEADEAEYDLGQDETPISAEVEVEPTEDDDLGASDCASTSSRARGRTASAPGPSIILLKSPADCALTRVAIVASSHTGPDTTADHESASILDTRRINQCQSVHSSDGVFRAVWQDAEMPSDEDGNVGDIDLGRVSTSQSSQSYQSTAGKHRSKLTGWEWEPDDPENGEAHTGHAYRRRSRFPSGDEGVPAPPNTGRSSQVPSRPESLPESRATTPEGNKPAWLSQNLRARSSSPTRARPESIMRNADSARRSSTAIEKDRYLVNHQDSLVIHRRHLAESKLEKTSAGLVSTRDSFVLAKSRLERWPKDSAFNRLKIGNLSPILDMSPPDIRFTPPKGYDAKKSFKAWQPESGEEAPAVVQWTNAAASVEIRGHAANDHECSICAVERPRTTAKEAAAALWH